VAWGSYQIVGRLRDLAGHEAGNLAGIVHGAGQAGEIEERCSVARQTGGVTAAQVLVARRTSQGHAEMQGEELQRRDAAVVIKA
jgi:hypothetical protein